MTFSPGYACALLMGFGLKQKSHLHASQVRTFVSGDVDGQILPVPMGLMCIQR
jgi:hypothetical protein